MTRFDEEMAWAQMCTAWSWAGWRVGDPFLAAGGESIGIGLSDRRSWKDWVISRWVTSGSNLTLDRVKALAATSHFRRIRFLYGYPGAIYEFCDLLKAIGDRPPQLAGVVCTAEVMRPEVRDGIGSTLGVPAMISGASAMAACSPRGSRSRRIARVLHARCGRAQGRTRQETVAQ